MRERLAFERELGRLSLPPGQGGFALLEREAKAPALSGQAGEAAQALWEIIRLLGRQQDVNAADPDKARNPPAWQRRHLGLLRQWFLIVYGEAAGSGRKTYSGEVLKTKVDAAFQATAPLLDLLWQKGGKTWRDQLKTLFYPKVAELEEKAVLSGVPTPRGGGVAVTFPERPPKPVTLAQFLSTVATRETRPILIQRGYGGFSLGHAKAGDVFSTSQQERRVLLWSDGGQAVFFERDGQIYAQSGKGFSEDILLGAFVLGAQNAAGAALLSQLMIETALSFTPWGLLWDGISAMEALTRRDWKGAALAILPGPALSLASKTRAFRKTLRGAAITTHLAAQVARKAVLYAGRGGYWLKNKLLSGFWVVGKDKSIRFFDEAAQSWHTPKDAGDYIKCSVCSYTARGKKAALISETDRVIAELPAVFRSRGRSLIPRQKVADVMEAYGAWGDHVIECLSETCGRMPNPVKTLEDMLGIAKDLSRIKSAGGYQHAIDIFDDFASSSVHTARGAMYELRWAAQHVDEIAQMGVPTYRKGWQGVGKGLDVMKKNGAAVELKSYDFTSWFYKNDPRRAAARIARQAQSRLAFKKPAVSSVTFVFDSAGGLMPPAFKAELDAAIAALNVKGGAKVSYGFWP